VKMTIEELRENHSCRLHLNAKRVYDLRRELEAAAEILELISRRAQRTALLVPELADMKTSVGAMAAVIASCGVRAASIHTDMDEARIHDTDSTEDWKVTA